MVFVNYLIVFYSVCASRIKNLLLQKQYLFNDIVAKLKIIKAFFINIFTDSTMYKILDIDNKTHLHFFLCTFKKST